MSETMTMHIPAVHCDACIQSIQKIVERQGASFDSGDPDTKNVTISYDDAKVTRDQIVEALTDAEFAPEAT